MEQTSSIRFLDDCAHELNSAQSQELNRFIASAVISQPYAVEPEDAENKKGFINKYNINVSYGIRSNAGDAYVELVPTNKVRGMIPSIFGGITGNVKRLSSAESDKFDPVTILSVLSAFVGFIKILAEGLGELWKKLDEWLNHKPGEEDKMKTKAFKSEEDLEKKKDELNFAHAGTDAKIPSEVFPTSSTDLTQMHLMNSQQSGMGVYKVYRDGRRVQVIDPAGKLAKELIVYHPGELAVRLEPEVVGILFKWLTPDEDARGGNIWGRWHVYEAE